MASNNQGIAAVIDNSDLKTLGFRPSSSSRVVSKKIFINTITSTQFGFI